MISRDKYLGHIKSDEKKFKMRKIIDKIEIVLKNHSIENTDFLDPYEVKLAKSILNSFLEIDYKVSGAYKGAERQVIVIYPEYMDAYNIEDGLSVLQIEGYLKNTKHQDYLGALMNLGIERAKLGDILVYENKGVIILKKEIKNYIIYNLDKVSNINVDIKEIDRVLIERPVEDYEEKKEFLKSLRIDALISAAYNLSRKDSKNLLNNNRVKLNWEPIDSVSREVDEGDLISVRGFGRFFLYKIEGKSKKSRHICLIRKLL